QAKAELHRVSQSRELEAMTSASDAEFTEMPQAVWTFPGAFAAGKSAKADDTVPKETNQTLLSVADEILRAHAPSKPAPSPPATGFCGPFLRIVAAFVLYQPILWGNYRSSRNGVSGTTMIE